MVGPLYLIADTFKKVFINIGNTLKIDKNKRFLVEKKDILDPFVKAIKKYSVILAFLKSNKRLILYFRNVTYEKY